MSRSLSGAALALAATVLGGLPPRTAHAAAPPPDPVANLIRADGWAQQPPGRDRDRILERWSQFASLPDLVFVLRHSTAVLGPIEGTLLARAVEHCPPERAALRRRLVTRLVASDPEAAKKLDLVRELKEGTAPDPASSVFRIGLLVPSGDAYADYARSLRAGLAAGLADTARAFAIELRAYETGDDDPARTVAALDSAARECGALVGELLSAPTLLAAAGARFTGTPLVSPTATDEAIGAMGRGVYALGPSAYERGTRIAAATVTKDARVGMLVGSNATPAFSAGFEAGALAAGAKIEWRAPHVSGTAGVRQESKDIASHKLDLLFWDGESREAEALLRELSKNKVSVPICGGSALSPDQAHAESRFLLEGVRFVGEEWTLPPALAGALDSLGRNGPGGAADPVFVRGALAGRLLRAAVRGGALCPEEIVASLDSRRGRGEYLASHGFLDFGRERLTLPVFTVSQGKAVASP